MKQILDLNDLMVEQLRELYDVEVNLSLFLKRLMKQTNDDQLADQLKNYRKITVDNHLVLKQVFNDLFTQKRGEKSEAVRLMEKQMEKILERCATDEVRDAAMIIRIQHIIHYKIASYGAVTTYAKIIGLYDDAAKLHRLLEIEKSIDRKLANLADMDLDRKAHEYHFN